MEIGLIGCFQSAISQSVQVFVGIEGKIRSLPFKSQLNKKMWYFLKFFVILTNSSTSAGIYGRQEE